MQSVQVKSMPSNNESTNILTRVESTCNHPPVIRFEDIEKRLRHQLDADALHLKSNYEEQNKLRQAVIRFQDLEKDAKFREERAARIMALMGSDHFKSRPKTTLTKRDLASREVAVSVVDDLPLWQAIRAIVEQVTEIQIVELQHALEYFDRKASRQAIESALASHKETFETKLRNREKFVSMRH